MVKYLKNQVKAISKEQVSEIENKVKLVIVQQPIKARVAGRKETKNSSRRLVDPQPIVQLQLDDDHNNNIIEHSLGSYFIRASIECVGYNNMDSFLANQRKSKFPEEKNDEIDVLRGTTTSAVQFYKESPYAACCIFGNLSVRFKGTYRLRFDLYELQSFASNGKPKIIHWDNATTYSSNFTVYTDSSFDGLEASPVLNEQLRKAGCRIRTRKPKAITNSPSQASSNNGQQYALALKGDYKVVKPKPINRLVTDMSQLPPQLLSNFYNHSNNSSQSFSTHNDNYFDSPIPSRSVTPIPRIHSVVDVYSRSATPVQQPINFSSFGTPMSSQAYFTPSTPQTRGSNDIFSTPMTHTIDQQQQSQAEDLIDTTNLDLSPLESDELLFKDFQTVSNSNLNYALGDEGSSMNQFAGQQQQQDMNKINFDNLDNLYHQLTSTDNSNNNNAVDQFALLSNSLPQQQVPRGQNGLLFNNQGDSSIDVNTLLEESMNMQAMQQQQNSFNPFTLNMMELKF